MAVVAPARNLRAMATAPPDTHSHQHIFKGLDDSVGRLLGADIRLIYGFAVPMLMIVGLIVVLALQPQTWLVISIVVLELAALGVVVYGFIGILNDEENEDDTSLG
jgi:hypothetical protein